MSAHTPGPWHWEVDAVKNDPFSRNRYQVTAVGETITKIYYSSFEGGPTNAEANARLIAAAPDLLAALEACLAVISGEDMNKMSLENGLRLSRAAIAKARS